MTYRKPTKAQRLRIYSRALALYNETPRYMRGGMCYCIVTAQKEFGMFQPNSLTEPLFSMKAIEADKFNNMELNFPEIFAYKPKLKFVYQYWWSTYSLYGQRKRIKIFKAAIEACKPINSFHV